MSAQALIDIARTLVADDKGLLAMDEHAHLAVPGRGLSRLERPPRNPFPTGSRPNSFRTFA